MSCFVVISDLVHLTDSASGNLLTLDRQSGSVLWQTPMQSPIVALYLAQSHDMMSKVPFRSFSTETLNTLLDDYNDPSAAVKQLE